ncbi:hypothetical protein PF005_g21751 [Phytophthora fragariae]|uniref:Uncharacterized protein n=1 Tax=Phytophthora fragariae TaxID=53985 RepID=A0A6A3WFN3_9STRA|nr:hypothetical protein PF005_g21751 [Phytophthora fragariae]KAE9194950.1 hypothetical protein PF004_g20576 [Phytophthora fragariae]KAE9196868.1 hypothetical protein PF002_g22921 [Phytophthora fragariae]
MYRELTIASTVPQAKLKRAFKTGKLSLSAAELKGSGSVLHLHPGSFDKALKARKRGFKFAKDSGLLSRAVDAAVPTLDTAVGVPQAAIPARGAIKQLTGVGVDGGKIRVADVAHQAKQALRYASKKGVLTDLVDLAEKNLKEKATKPEHVDLISTLRTSVKDKYGVGVVPASVPGKKRLVKGSTEAQARMAALRAMRKGKSKGGSFRL